ncbi:hypothetical protein [Fodinibius sp. Rm-B-1B1-1]|uniref:hypothetical protein n=1 Tax=Fodinibius alkaliphilus TaxID=3140241 RepID=UPI00315B0D1B
MLKNLKQSVKRNLVNIPGWRTDRKIVVIESDDWGSIRMPSKEVYEKCLKAGYGVDHIIYERVDSLASEDDLELLFNLLSSIKDHKGNSPVITANVLMANPDFEKIKEAHFQKYFYELITETFKKYPNHHNCFELWKEGKRNRLFYPQSHGREHLNVSLFMNALQQGDEDVHFGFKNGLPGCISKNNGMKGNKYVESLRFNNEIDKKYKLDIVLEGLDLFENLMGYHSESFIPPNYIWSPDFDEKVSKRGVRYYQGCRKMKEPRFDGSFRFNTHILGKENTFGQKYLVRNAIFEPAMNNSRSDTVEKCLKDINSSFRFNKPAIICSHRLNYVGHINEQNRDKNLKLLERLLTEIVKKWPDVEFMNSVQLGKMME